MDTEVIVIRGDRKVDENGGVTWENKKTYSHLVSSMSVDQKAHNEECIYGLEKALTRIDEIK